VTYPGFPFPPLTPLYPSYRFVQEYHADYADHWNLSPHIKLDHSVSSALWIGNSTQGYWDVTVQIGYPVEIIPGSSRQVVRHYAESEFSAHFDHLVVANGHNHYPEIPSWARNTEWPDGHKGRTIIHSIYYRDPKDYAGKKVLVIGAGASGADIASQVKEFAETVLTFRTIHFPPSELIWLFRHTTLSGIKSTGPTFPACRVSSINQGLRI
jgi:cation diffusion facilitator CzcD-associated flavoprotein CzcO